MNSEFEKQLERQPMRELPHEWRSEILAGVSRRVHLDTATVAQTSKSAVSRVSKPATPTNSVGLPTWKSAIQQVGNLRYRLAFWRRIVAVSRCAPSRTERVSAINRFSTWLWPHPRAWAGLAAAWVLILLLHFTAPDEPRTARNSSPMTFQTLATMQKQTLMMAQLLGSLDNGDQPAAAVAPPKPRSERARKERIG
jgi:hypothetical protein